MIQQGLEIHCFWFQKKTVQRKTALHLCTKGMFFFKKQFNFKTFVQNPRIVRLVLCSAVYLKVIHLFTVVVGSQADTGKSLSEVLIYSSINQQYDSRLFNELRVQYEKITRAEHVKNKLFTQIV